jgi:hypothetical protein
VIAYLLKTPALISLTPGIHRKKQIAAALAELGGGERIHPRRKVSLAILAECEIAVELLN